MAHRVIDAVLKTMTYKQESILKDSYTEEITLTTDAMTSSKEVKKYRKKLQLKLQEVGIENTYFAWYLTSNYGKQANEIVDKMYSFNNKRPETKLIRAELWFGIHYEMINSLSDFFVRRTGRLYFDIASVSVYKNTIIKDCITYLNWDDKRIKKEKEILSILIKDATHFYNKELL